MHTCWCGRLTRGWVLAGVRGFECDSLADTSDRLGVLACRLLICRWANFEIVALIKGGDAARTHGRVPKHLPAPAQRRQSRPGSRVWSVPGQRQGDGRALACGLERSDEAGCDRPACAGDPGY